MKIQGLEFHQDLLECDYDFNCVYDTYWSTPDGTRFSSEREAVEEILNGNLHGCLVSF